MIKVIVRNALVTAIAISVVGSIPAAPADANLTTEQPPKPVNQQIEASLVAVDEGAKTITVRCQQQNLTFHLTTRGSLNTASAKRIKSAELKKGDLADWKKGDRIYFNYNKAGTNLIARYVENRTLAEEHTGDAIHAPPGPMLAGAICFLALLLLSFVGICNVVRNYYTGKMSGARALFWVILRVAIGLASVWGLSFLTQEPGFGEILIRIAGS